MHIPDNYLSPATCAVMGAVMVPVWTKAVTKVKKEVSKKKLPLLGTFAAVSFGSTLVEPELLGVGVLPQAAKNAAANVIVRIETIPLFLICTIAFTPFNLTI